jgi:hypothetical protein
MAISLRNQISEAIRALNDKQAQAASLRTEIDLLLGELQALVEDYQILNEPPPKVPLKSTVEPPAFLDN